MYIRKLWKSLEESLGNAEGPRPWIRECSFVESAPLIRPIVTWGIFNPLGPTVESLSLTQRERGGNQVLYWKLSNPFLQEEAAVGIVPGDAGPGVITANCRAAFLEPGADGETLLQSAPSFVAILAASPIETEEIEQWFKAGLRLAGVEGLAQLAREIRSHWLNPWERVGNFAAMLGELLSNPAGSAGNASGPFTEEQFAEWWDVVTHPEHVSSEFRQLVQAWTGSQHFASGWGSSSSDAVGPHEGLRFHLRLLEAAQRSEAR